ncbi:MAG: lamin tail domain-containing protein [Candidatus Marinimicrobia bacterium]|nr:lamin tail domain-containing protein [Candidatus Neomarinimicrobiota bacterium]
MNRITVMIIMICSLASGQATDLFFSEYAEGGSGNNKYIEIYNGTGADIDLSNYQVWGSNNGGDWKAARQHSLSGTLVDGDVYVMAADAADQAILDETDLALAYESAMHYTGDDAVGLAKDNGTGTFELIDVIGVPDNDPGSGWNVAGVVDATKDHTLVRKASVTTGNTNWTTSAGTNATDSEWKVYDDMTWDYIGSHPHVDPVIADIALDPSSPTEPDDVTVSATITDDGTIASATLTYNTGTADTDVTMTITTGDTYAGTIPAQTAGTTVKFLITAVDNEGNSSTSDETTYLVMPTSGTIIPIYDIQYVSDPATDDASPLDGQTVTISGVVTAEFWGSSSNRYLYVQDAEGPWNGVVVFEYDGWDEFDFTTSAGITHSVAEGDSVTLTGTVDEYFGLTEIVDVTDVIIHGPAVNMISPSAVTAGQVMTGGSEAEAYEGCLVKIVSVVVDGPDLGNGEWSISDGTNSMRVDDIWDYYYFPENGQALAEVSGVMTYTYSDTKLEPRLARDIIEAVSEPVRIQRIQQVLYSDLLLTSEDSESDISYLYGDTVTVLGIVTMPTGLSYAGDGIKFIFQDENGGPWSSILCYDPDSSAFPVLYEGDSIQATGYVFEYTTDNSNMTELFITEPVNIIGIGSEVPEPELIETGDLRWPTEAEQWGNVTVRIEEGIVTNNDLQYEVFEVDDGSGGVLVDDDSDSIAVHFDAVGPPPVGSFVTSIEGWVYHHYGYYSDSTTYKLEPLYMSDIVFGAGPPTLSDVSRDPCTPSTTNAVTVTAVIEDNSAIASAAIMYAVNGGSYSSASMTLGTDNTWTGTIPATGTDGARVDYYITATDDGSEQDSPKTSTYPYDIEVSQHGYLTYAGGGINDISDIQYTSWPGGDTPYNGCEVTVTGIITADTAQYNSDYGAYVLQSASAVWSGIVFDGWDDTELTRGDEVTITGTVEEYDPEWHFKYDNNTKLINISSLTTNSTGNSIVPISVSTADLNVDADEVESYEGCLVTLSNVTVSSANSYDWSIVDDSGVECLIDDDMANMAAFNFLSGLAEGTTLSSVTGIFNFSFGTYKIQIRDLADLGGLGINDDFDGITREFALYPNYPNPFNPETRIRFQLAKHSDVKLMIYDVLGRNVRTLVSDKMDAGHHVINWNGLNDQGANVASGMYIYRIKAGDFIAHRKMLLVR